MYFSQVYLIEVNTSPALFRAGAHLAELLPLIIEEVVQKTVDMVFPPPSHCVPGATIPQLDGFEKLDLTAGPAASCRDASSLRGSKDIVQSQGMKTKAPSKRLLSSTSWRC
jgi:hypothetical protein